MMHISEQDTSGLRELVEQGELCEEEVLEVLRSPFCTSDIAERVLDHRAWTGSHVVRERLAGFRGLSLGRALNLLPTLPWLSLLHLAQQPRTSPRIRRESERRLISRIQRLTLGEKVALARLAHRPLFRKLVTCGDPQVLTALLDNPRTVENDVLLILNDPGTPRDVARILAGHERWGSRYEVRREVVCSPVAPVPVALAALVRLRRNDQAEVAAHPGVRKEVREAASALVERSREGDRLPR